MSLMRELPVDGVLPELIEGLKSHGSAVLLAPPGAGKSTRVPPAMLSSGLVGDGKIWMLQPRRAAAKLVARRIAEELSTPLGQKVGYSVRFESARSESTRIEVLTEGLLTRRLQVDPFLEGVSAVVFDEFHERSLHADLTFSLVREIQKEARPDLRILVMSATLDPEAVSAHLSGCPIIRAEGRSFPVDIRFEPRIEKEKVWTRCAATVRQALKEEAQGHVLVFLPGVGEITRLEDELTGLKGVDVLPLHGRMKLSDQERALAPSRRRKVILSTNLAESSITIEGVRTVIDTGFVRRSRFEPALGFSRLEMMRISQASADQRAGRAGRTDSGTCYRLWTAGEHQGMQPYDIPEIRGTDMARALLEIYAWGSDPVHFPWFESPKEAHMNQALVLLKKLGLVADGRITSRGTKALSLPLHPRLGSLVLCGVDEGIPNRAVAVATILSEPNIFRRFPKGMKGCDLEVRLDLLGAFERGGNHVREIGGEPNRRALSNCIKVRQQIMQQLGLRAGTTESNSPQFKKILVDHFPERVGAQRGSGSDRYRLAGGQGIILDEESLAKGQGLILALGIRAARRGERADHRVSLATILDLKEVDTVEGVDIYFDREREAVVHRKVRRLGDLVVSEHQMDTKPDPVWVAQVLAEEVAKNPGKVLKFNKEERNLLDRISFLSRTLPDLHLPSMDSLELPTTPSEQSLLSSLCFGLKSFEELRRLELLDHIRGALTFEQNKALDAYAPERFKLPNGTHGAISYEGEGPPVLRARVQQLFGLTENPTVASGRVALLLHILAPNKRPVQVTQDLKSFWSETYAQVRKDLRGRYPKHPWPEDPTRPIPPRRRSKT
jgi:ATP-dependent helicase HrpB